MKTLLQSLSVGVLCLTGVGVMTTTSVSAASLTDATINGSASSDFYVYDVNSSSQTVRVPSPTASDVQRVLDGNASSPTGNVELAASSEQAGFDFTKTTTLQGNLDGKSITLSSLTLSDWTTVLASGKTLQQQWFDDLTAKYPIANSTLRAQAFAAFSSSDSARARLSDPNVSYVNSEADGSVKIGLAGFYDLKVIAASTARGLKTNESSPIPDQLLALVSSFPAPIQASELVKVTYNNQTSYLYSFSATRSGLLAADDGLSHSGNYEVTLKPVPVPPAFIGIAFAGAMGAGMLKRRKIAA